MSLLPHYMDRWGLRHPHHLVDHHYSVLPHEDLLPIAPLLSREYYRPWHRVAAAVKDLGSNIKVDKDKLQINLDVQHFTPDEISVKTADGYIIVQGKHEEKKDEHGFVSRQFSRRYALPEGTIPETIESKLSSDGMLTITVPKTIPDSIKGERKVPITRTGPVRKNIKDQNEGTSDHKEEK